MAHPDLAIRELDRVDSAESLLSFIRLAWTQLEPANRFVYGWPVEAICDHLSAVSRGEITRLLINVPPGCMKSMTVNVFWPAWEWGPLGRPDLRYISAAYEKNLSTRDLVRCRDLIQSEWYQAIWPIQFKDDQNLKTFYETQKGGWRFSGSVGGSLVGYRGDRILIDDPHDVRAAESDVKRMDAIRWFTEVIPTRLNNQSKSSIVVIMQRLHEQDVSGVVLSELLDDWEHLVLPMEYDKPHRCWSIVPSKYGIAEMMVRKKSEEDPLPVYEPHPEGRKMWPQDPRTEEGELLWPARFDYDAVEKLKRTFRSQGGSYAEACQLQQRPSPRGGGMFKRQWFQIVDACPQGKAVRRVRGWDLAATKDDRAAFTAGLKMALVDGMVVIEDIARGQLSPFAVERLLRSCARADGVGCPISLPQDPGQAGKTQKSALAKLLHGYRVHFSRETGSKEDRAKPFAAQAEAGNVLLVRGDWNTAFLAEAQMFPASRFKDQIDAASRAYAYLVTIRSGRGSFASGVAYS